MICEPCKTPDHLVCETPSCTCGHAGSPVRALTSAERLAVVLGAETGNVRLREGA
jgi:hypothetical protein